MNTPIPTQDSAQAKVTDMTTQQASKERANLISEVAEEHGLNEDAFLIWCDNYHISKDYEEQVDAFTDAFCGYWQDFAEFAEQLFDDCHVIPDDIAPYIDYERYARDLTYSGDFWEEQGYVFRAV